MDCALNATRVAPRKFILTFEHAHTTGRTRLPHPHTRTGEISPFLARQGIHPCSTPSKDFV
jgi:hypothetical protein